MLIAGVGQALVSLGSLLSLRHQLRPGLLGNDLWAFAIDLSLGRLLGNLSSKHDQNEVSGYSRPKDNFRCYLLVAFVAPRAAAVTAGVVSGAARAITMRVTILLGDLPFVRWSSVFLLAGLLIIF